jgi:predicted dehydrogenase
VEEVRVALVGYQFMGRAHSNAYRQVSFYYPELQARPVMRVLVGRKKQLVDELARRFGWEETEYSVEAAVAREDIELVDITAPNNVHAELAIKAAQAGKHVFCEKPLATSLEDALKAREAVEKAGVINTVCHNYRRAPAVALARRMMENEDLGEIYHWRALYLQDWAMDPNVPLMWRFQKRIAGSGALGDLMAHSIDLALWLVGDITRVACTMKTWIRQRPKAAAVDGGLGGAAVAGAMGRCDVDDGVVTLCEFANGALGTFEATRFAAGHKNYNWFEINGSKGSIIFNLERMNELLYYNGSDPADRRGFRVIQATETVHPYMGLPGGGPRYWPVAHIIGYEHTFINVVAEVLQAIATGGPSPEPTFATACRTQAVLHACEQAAKSGEWVKVPKV